MICDREDSPRMQSDFFRDSYYKLLHWLLISILVILLLILSIIYYVIFTDPHQYYASTTAGEIIPMIPK